MPPRKRSSRRGGPRPGSGPKPVLHDPVLLSAWIERQQRDAVDAHAAQAGSDRSKAVRELLARGLDRH